MAYTDVWDVTAPLDTQAANQGAADFRATKLDVMQRIASFGAGLAANRPTPEATSGTADWTGVMYWATDTQKVYRWNGTSWDDISADIPSSGAGHFSDATQGSVLNPTLATALNTVSVPDFFNTGAVVRITVDGVLISSAGSPGVKMTIDGVDSFNQAFATSSNNEFLYDIVLQAISTTEFNARGVYYLGASGDVVDSKLLSTGPFGYTVGTPFNVVLAVSGAFTGSANTFGMAASIN